MLLTDEDGQLCPCWVPATCITYWRRRASSMQMSCKTEDSSPHPWLPSSSAGLTFQGPVLIHKGWAHDERDRRARLPRPSPWYISPEQYGILAGSNLNGDMPLLIIVLGARETPESLISRPRMLASMLRKPRVEPQGPRHPTVADTREWLQARGCLSRRKHLARGRGSGYRVSSDDHHQLAVCIL